MTRINLLKPELLADIHLMSKEQIVKALSDNDWYVQKTAKSMGITRQVLITKMRVFKIVSIRKRGTNSRQVNSIHVKHPKFKVAINTWRHIKKRCLNPKCGSYIYYGARGIRLHHSWVTSFDEFFSYCLTLKNSFEKDYSIDRENNNGNYEPGNLRFIKHVDQCNNRRSNRLYTLNNETFTLAEIAKNNNLKWEFLRDRLKLGWTLEEAISIPKGKKRDTN